MYGNLPYYLRNRGQVDAYLEAWWAYSEQAWLEHERDLSPEIRRLRELKADRTALQEETLTS